MVSEIGGYNDNTTSNNAILYRATLTRTGDKDYLDVNTSSLNDMEGGGKVSVGTAAVEVTFIGKTKSIIITADKDNTGTLYVGKSDVDSSGNNAITFLQAGEVLEMDYEDEENGLYVVAGTASQNFWKGALL